MLLKHTDFLDDDIQYSGWAWGGKSQLDSADVMQGRAAKSLADELGFAGIPRDELVRHADIAAAAATA